MTSLSPCSSCLSLSHTPPPPLVISHPPRRIGLRHLSLFASSSKTKSVSHIPLHIRPPLPTPAPVTQAPTYIVRDKAASACPRLRFLFSHSLVPSLFPFLLYHFLTALLPCPALLSSTLVRSANAIHQKETLALSLHLGAAAPVSSGACTIGLSPVETVPTRKDTVPCRCWERTSKSLQLVAFLAEMSVALSSSRPAVIVLFLFRQVRSFRSTCCLVHDVPPPLPSTLGPFLFPTFNLISNDTPFPVQTHSARTVQAPAGFESTGSSQSRTPQQESSKMSKRADAWQRHSKTSLQLRTLQTSTSGKQPVSARTRFAGGPGIESKRKKSQRPQYRLLNAPWATGASVPLLSMPPEHPLASNGAKEQFSSTFSHTRTAKRDRACFDFDASVALLISTVFMFSACPHVLGWSAVSGPAAAAAFRRLVSRTQDTTAARVGCTASLLPGGPSTAGRPERTPKTNKQPSRKRNKKRRRKKKKKKDQNPTLTQLRTGPESNSERQANRTAAKPTDGSKDHQRAKQRARENRATQAAKTGRVPRQGKTTTGEKTALPRLGKRIAANPARRATRDRTPAYQRYDQAITSGYDSERGTADGQRQKGKPVPRALAVIVSSSCSRAVSLRPASKPASSSSSRCSAGKRWQQSNKKLRSSAIAVCCLKCPRGGASTEASQHLPVFPSGHKLE